MAKRVLSVVVLCLMLLAVHLRWNAVERHREASHVQHTYGLPKCQEDEVLYPYDYKGPGRNAPGDYGCVHIDSIILGENWTPTKPNN